MQNQTKQHGGGQLEEEITIHNSNGQVYERFLNWGTCP